MLRASVIWQSHTFSYLVFSLLFLSLLVYPFIVRYRLIIKNTEEFDSILEKYYIQIIQQGYSNLIKEIKSSRAIIELKKSSTEAHNEITNDKLNAWLAYFESIGDKFEDPAIKSIEKADPRIFIDKGSLSRYLGKL